MPLKAVTKPAIGMEAAAFCTPTRADNAETPGKNYSGQPGRADMS